MTTYKVPSRACDPAFVAKAIGIPLSAWAGNCSGVCAEALRSKVVKGELRRGLWVGCISKDSPLFGNRPFTGHTWIRLPDGRVYDPTRFAFTGDEPSIFITYNTEEHSKEYDFGGNALRRAFRSPFPFSVEEGKWMVLRLKKSTADKLITLAGPGSGLRAKSTTKKLCGAWVHLRLTWPQAAWLANTTLEELGTSAEDYFRVLVRLGHGAMIPYDNREAVLGK